MNDDERRAAERMTTGFEWTADGSRFVIVQPPNDFEVYSPESANALVGKIVPISGTEFSGRIEEAFINADGDLQLSFSVVPRV